MEGGSGSFKRVFKIAVLVGVLSGISSLLFFEGLKVGADLFMGSLVGFQMPLEGQLPDEIARWSAPSTLWLILPVICLGGLLSGIIAHSLAPEVGGAGQDAAIRAFHKEGTIRKRVPFLKALATILVISTGGSAGREGPTAQISAGIGSIVADMLGLSEHERRLAIVTGIGAGVGAIFKAPLGGALLAAEVLYIRDFESEAIVSSFIASVIAYAIFCSFEGFEPIFILGNILWTVHQIPFFILLGAACAAFGLLYIRAFHGLKRFFDAIFMRHGLPGYLRPFAGVFLVGILVVILAQVSPDAETLALAGLGTGYGFLQLALYSMLPLPVLILLPFFKIITTSLTIGSGGSGGLFGPGLVIGGSAGGALGTVLHLLLPALVPLQTIPVFIVVGMIALFGAIANAPLAVMIMVVEMTGDFSLLVPAMGAVAVSHLLTGEESIFLEQVFNRSRSEAHRGEYEIVILERILVEEAMVKGERVLVLSPRDPSAKVLELINATGHTGFPVVEAGRLEGIITIGDIRSAEARGNLSTPVGEVMARNLVTVIPAQSLEEALRLMINNDIHHLPVVRSRETGELIGFLTRSDIMREYARHIAEVKSGRTEHENR
jgi:CIC family chloride channel protein